MVPLGGPPRSCAPSIARMAGLEVPMRRVQPQRRASPAHAARVAPRIQPPALAQVRHVGRSIERESRLLAQSALGHRADGDAAEASAPVPWLPRLALVVAFAGAIRRCAPPGHWPRELRKKPRRVLFSWFSGTSFALDSIGIVQRRHLLGSY